MELLREIQVIVIVSCFLFFKYVISFISITLLSKKYYALLFKP